MKIFKHQSLILNSAEIVFIGWKNYAPIKDHIYFNVVIICHIFQEQVWSIARHQIFIVNQIVACQTKRQTN